MYIFEMAKILAFGSIEIRNVNVFILLNSFMDFVYKLMASHPFDIDVLFF